MAGAQAGYPGFNLAVIDAVPGVDIGQRFQRHLVAPSLQCNVLGQCLLDDPASRALKPRGQSVALIGQGRGTCEVMTRVSVFGLAMG